MGRGLVCEFLIQIPHQGTKKGWSCRPVCGPKLAIHRFSRPCPGVPGPAVQAEPIPTTNPHAQVTKMAFAWSKNQTPSNESFKIKGIDHSFCDNNTPPQTDRPPHPTHPHIGQYGSPRVWPYCSKLTWGGVSCASFLSRSRIKGQKRGDLVDQFVVPN